MIEGELIKKKKFLCFTHFARYWMFFCVLLFQVLSCNHALLLFFCNPAYKTDSQLFRLEFKHSVMVGSCRFRCKLDNPVSLTLRGEILGGRTSGWLDKGLSIYFVKDLARFRILRSNNICPLSSSSSFLQTFSLSLNLHFEIIILHIEKLVKVWRMLDYLQNFTTSSQLFVFSGHAPPSRPRRWQHGGVHQRNILKHSA